MVREAKLDNAPLEPLRKLLPKLKQRTKGCPLVMGDEGEVEEDGIDWTSMDDVELNEIRDLSEVQPQFTCVHANITSHLGRT